MCLDPEVLGVIHRDELDVLPVGEAPTCGGPIDPWRGGGEEPSSCPDALAIKDDPYVAFLSVAPRRDASDPVGFVSDHEVEPRHPREGLGFGDAGRRGVGAEDDPAASGPEEPRDVGWVSGDPHLQLVAAHRPRVLAHGVGVGADAQVQELGTGLYGSGSRR